MGGSVRRNWRRWRRPVTPLQKTLIHVNEKKGLSNDAIDYFLRRTCGSDFLGVYSADYLPVRLAGRGRFIVVVNLGRRKGRTVGPLPVGHFVTIVATPEEVYYLDPYGIPCVDGYVLRFLRSCQRTIQTLSYQIQSFDSVWCGLYAILFALYMDRQASARPPRFKLHFFKQKNKLIKNDDKCGKYIEKLIMNK